MLVLFAYVQRAGEYLGPAFLGLIAAGIIAFSVYSLWLAWTPRLWPSTQGKIVSSGVVVSRSTGKEDSPGYEPSVRYAYTVRGTPYSGKGLALVQDIGLSLGGAERIARKYPAGSIVTVYYDPKKPTSSVLVRGITALGPIAGLLVGCLVLVIALVGFGTGGLGRQSVLTDHAVASGL